MQECIAIRVVEAYNMGVAVLVSKGMVEVLQASIDNRVVAVQAM